MNLTRNLVAVLVLVSAATGAFVARAAWPDSYPGRIAMLDALRHDMAYPGIMYDAAEVARRYDHACEEKSSTACLWQAWQTDAGGDLKKASAQLANRCPKDPQSCLVVGWAAVLDDKGRIVSGAPGAGTAVQKFKESCDKAYAAGCTSLGELYAAGVGVTKDLARARSLFSEGCQAEDYWGCYQLGALEEAKEDGNLGIAAEYYRKACQQKIPHACVALGRMMETGQGLPANPEQAVKVYEQGCKGKYAGGCSELGRMYAEGRYVKKSPAVALGLYKTACDGGDAKACFGMAEMYVQGGAGEEGIANAVAIYDEACTGGVAAACSRLGDLYMEGKGVSRDEEKGKVLLQKACEKGEGDGCAVIGWMYESGEGMKMNLTRAVKMYQHGCNVGSANACFRLSKLYEIGKGVTQSAPRALALVRQSCENGHTEACSIMARRYMTGNAVYKDLAKAAQLFELACNGGFGDSCATLGVLHENGEGVDPDQAKALEFYQRACAAESGAGCYAVGQAHEKGDGLPVDFRGALKHYRLSCELGYERGCSAAGPVTFQARFEELVYDAFRSDICQIWSLDPEDPENNRVLAEVRKDSIRVLAGPRQGRTITLEDRGSTFDDSDEYIGDSTWLATGDGVEMSLVHREIWNPRMETIDEFPGEVSYSPDRSGGTQILYSRELETLRRKDPATKCRFTGGYAELAAEQCSEIQALMAAQQLTVCKGE